MVKEFGAIREVDGEIISSNDFCRDRVHYQNLAETLSKLDQNNWRVACREVSEWAPHSEPSDESGQVQAWLDEKRMSGFVHRVAMFRDYQEWASDDSYTTFKRNTFYAHLYEILGEPINVKGELGWHVA